jgi:hypothetical protein
MEDWNGLQHTDVATIPSLQGLFSNVLSVALSLIGIVMFIMILVGGFKFITAGDDPKAAEAAKGTITSGITGVVVAIAAFFILLAIRGFTGVNLMNFSVGLPDAIAP